MVYQLPYGLVENLTKGQTPWLENLTKGLSPWLENLTKGLSPWLVWKRRGGMYPRRNLEPIEAFMGLLDKPIKMP